MTMTTILCNRYSIFIIDVSICHIILYVYYKLMNDSFFIHISSKSPPLIHNQNTPFLSTTIIEVISLASVMCKTYIFHFCRA